MGIESNTLNIFFTLFLGLTSIYIYDRIVKTASNKIFAIVISCIFVISIACLSQLTKCDYGFYGVIIIFLFYLFKDNKFKMSIAFILATIFKYLNIFLNYGYNSFYMNITLFTILALVPILLYNKTKGPNIKYFLYVFYPVHLVLIYIVSTYLI